MILTPPPSRRISRRGSTFLLAAALLTSALSLPGCQLGQLVGGMAQSAKRHGSDDKTARYTGLDGKSFAVICAADRSIQAEYAQVVTIITAEMSNRLAKNTTATGMLPPTEVLKYQSQHPGWVAKPLNELCTTLGVDRVVYVDLRDFSLTDPGNPYVYNGVASGVINVAEAESQVASEFAFSEPVKVQYPDSTGMSSAQISRAEVFSELSRRFIERAAWLFYAHEEKNDIKY